jgi:hypothetical protein
MKQWEHQFCGQFWESQNNLQNSSPVECSSVSLDEWPVYLRPLAEKLGPQVVWDASLAVHGFPPTWCRGAGEAFAIEKFLQQQGK